MNLGVTPYSRAFQDEVEGIQRDAVPSPSGARVEAHEAKRLGRGGVEDLPDVDPHPVEDDLQLVDERDVDGPEDVFHELGRLRGPRGGDAHGPAMTRS